MTELFKPLDPSLSVSGARDACLFFLLDRRVDAP